MSRPSLLTLTTDFGHKDPFAGIMKGVILSINPKARIVDITHGISPHNIREAAFVIAGSYPYFPPKSIHVVVVDPGVGSARRPILVAAQDRYFVGPDNGVFTPVIKSSEVVIHLTDEKYFLPSRSDTFHGRDIFAPVAAWLSKGIRPSSFGRKITDPVTIELPEARKSPSLPFSKGGRAGIVEGEVIYIDGFGNAITNIPRTFLEEAGADVVVTGAGKKIPLLGFYADARKGKLSAVINSSGFLELFIYMGNAAEKFKLKTGDGVLIKLRSLT